MWSTGTHVVKKFSAFYEPPSSITVLTTSWHYVKPVDPNSNYIIHAETYCSIFDLRLSFSDCFFPYVIFDQNCASICTPRPTHSPSFNHVNNILRKTQINMLLIMQLSTSFSYFLSCSSSLWRQTTHMLYRRVLGSIPDQCSICVRQLRPFSYDSLLRIFFSSFSNLNPGFHRLYRQLNSSTKRLILYSTCWFQFPSKLCPSPWLTHHM